MELTLDIGSDVYNDLEDAASKEGKKVDVMASSMLSLGLRVYSSSNDDTIDPNTALLLKNSIKSNEILTEVLYTIFDKNKSNLGVYDPETAIALIDRLVNKIMERAV